VAASWLPKTIYLSQFEDSSFRVVTNFDESIDVTKTTVAGGSQSGENLIVWREQDFRGRWEDWRFRNKVLVVGWNMEEGKGDAKEPPGVPSYAITLPDGLARSWQLDGNARLVFSVADTDEEPKKDEEENKSDKKEKEKEKQKNKEKEKEKDKKKEPVDFTVELVTADGANAQLLLSQFAPVLPILKVKYTKWGYLEKHWYHSPSEPVFRIYELPLAAFAQALKSPQRQGSPAELLRGSGQARSGFDLRKLRTIRFRFDRTQKRVILLDEIGFAR
jgi:hypothetical protein